MTTTPTPTPWAIEPCNASYSRRIVAPNGDTIAILAGQNGRDAERDANGAALLRAVNAHAALVAALREIESWGSQARGPTVDAGNARECARLARAALAQAGE